MTDYLLILSGRFRSEECTTVDGCYLRLFNEEARVVELMELQLKHRLELLLSEERICLERHKQELAVHKACVLYLESGIADSEFKERAQ